MATKLHFRNYNPKQLILFPERLDKDIAENDPVRVVDTVIDHLRLDKFKKLYKERGRSPLSLNRFFFRLVLLVAKMSRSLI